MPDNGQYLHLVPNAFNGGIEKDCYYIIKAGSDYRHVVLVLGDRGVMSSNWEKEGAEVHHLSILNKNPIYLLLYLKRFIKNFRFKGIYNWSPIHLPFIRQAFHGSGVNMIVHIGNPVHPSLKTLLKNMLAHYIFKSDVKTILFPCSDHVKKTLRQDLYYKKFSIVVSPNPVHLPNENLYIAKRLNPDSVINIGMTARLDPIKDHKTILKGLILLKQSFPNIKLHLLGDGPLKDHLKEFTNNHGLAESVNLYGNVNNVYDHLKEWDLFVYATTIREGLGNSVIEAMATGLPVVASALPMLKEIDGETESITFFGKGDPTDFFEKTKKLLLNQTLRNSKSRKSYYRAKQGFSISRYWNDRLQYMVSDE